MAKSTFVYVTYIRTTPQKMWSTLTTGDLLKRVWMGTLIESDWRAGSPWRAISSDGTLFDSGEILESVPEKKLVFSWQNQWVPEFKAEGYSRCSYEMEPIAASLKLTITHSSERPDSKFIAAVAGAWPMVASNLKSLLETGEVVLVDNPRHAH